MNAVIRTLFAAAGIAVLTLSIGLAASRLPALTPLAPLTGLLGAVGWRREWRWSASASLLGFAASAATSVLTGASPVWALVGITAALAYWDLAHFARRVELAERVYDERRLSGDHIRRLRLVAGVGMLLGLAALSLRLQLDLGWAMALGLIAIISLGQAIQFLRRASG